MRKRREKRKTYTVLTLLLASQVFRSSKFSIVLSKASILHRRYLDLYWRDDYSVVRDYVDDLKNCEDIAMGILVHREGGEARFVQGALGDSGVLSGISTKGGGKQVRACELRSDEGD